MDLKELFELYKRERDYQTTVFGDYKNNTSLNLASFLAFLQSYIEKAIRLYTSDWTEEIPSWLVSCREYEIQGTAPSKTYEELVKIFTLAGAALEVYTDMDIDEWRKEGPKQKWMKPPECK